MNELKKKKNLTFVVEQSSNKTNLTDKVFVREKTKNTHIFHHCKFSAGFDRFDFQRSDGDELGIVCRIDAQRRHTIRLL